MSFYPDDAAVPEELRTDEYVFRPLRTTDVDLDYEAVMESKEMLRSISNSDWPIDNFTKEENLEDLSRHEQDHNERREFTFTIMNPEETICLGCLYFRPLPPLLQSKHYETSVRFWVRQSRIADDLDIRVFRSIQNWLRDEWVFSRIVFVTGINEMRQPRIFTDAKLSLVQSDLPSHSSRFLYFE